MTLSEYTTLFSIHIKIYYRFIEMNPFNSKSWHYSVHLKIKEGGNI